MEFLEKFFRLFAALAALCLVTVEDFGASYRRWRRNHKLTDDRQSASRSARGSVLRQKMRNAHMTHV